MAEEFDLGGGVISQTTVLIASCLAQSSRPTLSAAGKAAGFDKRKRNHVTPNSSINKVAIFRPVFQLSATPLCLIYSVKRVETVL